MFDVLVTRLKRVLKLEDPVFVEIANDDNATVQAIIVTAVAAAIGGLLADGRLVTNLLTGLIVAPIGLFIWTGILYVVGKMFGGQATYMQLVRPIGYAGAPYALSIVPVIGGLAALVYSAVIQVRAIKEVNQVSQGAAIATVLIPLGILVVVSFILIVLAGIALMAAFN
jgi:hypothetical protein